MRARIILDEQLNLNKYLYHATYKQFLKSIFKNGLGNTKRKMWTDSKGRGVVYLSLDPDVAYSYAEEAEWLDDRDDPDIYLDNIVILKIDVSKLDLSKIFKDENVVSDEDSEIVEYHGIIPREAIIDVIDENGNKILTESDHTQKAIDALGITYYKNRAGFMLKDGRLLDLTDDGGTRDDHRAVQNAFDDVVLETYSDYLIEFMNEGNIRLIPELPGIDIMTPITTQQRIALKDYIQYWINRKQHFEVQFSNNKGSQVKWKEYNGFFPVNDIIYDIDYFFKSNVESGIELKEGFLDKEQKFYDYRTGEANLKSCDIFDKTKTGFSFYNNLIDDPEYMKKSKGLVGSIVMMTPNEYFEHCGEIFHTSKQTQIDHTLADKDNIEYLKQVILKYNKKFPIGYLNTRDKQQEGRHRMAVAGELCGYDTPQPVLIAQDVNNILYPNELILKEDYYNKIDLSSNDSDEDILKSIKGQFKSFENPSNITYGGYYILPSGEFLQAQNHLDIDKWLMRWGYIKRQSTDFADGSQYMEVKLNCVRVRCRGGKDDWIEPYIVLPKNRLTVSQKYSLLAWLDFAMARKDKVLIHTEVNNEFIAYDSKNYTSDEIIDKIDRFYTTGKLLK